MTTIAKMKERYSKLLQEQTEAHARGDHQSSNELSAQADELGERIYHREHGEMWDPEEGAWIGRDGSRN